MTEVRDETEALGHDVTEVVTVLEPTCTEKGNTTYKCVRCDVTEVRDETEALGHDISVIVEIVEPTCTEEGYTTYQCVRCDETEDRDFVAATGHTYEWVVVSVPTPAAKGVNEYTCVDCGDVAETELVKYTKLYFGNTITSFGIESSELIDTDDWYRVTAIDLSVDGIYTFDLVATNAYVVGTMTVTIADGTMTIEYELNTNNAEIFEEYLVLFANKADMAEGKGYTVPFGTTINLAETFGDDTKILVSMILVANYDAASYGVALFDANDYAVELAKMLELVD